MKENYIRLWFRDFWGIFTHELKTIFCDGGVLIIFFVAGLGYPCFTIWCIGTVSLRILLLLWWTGLIVPRAADISVRLMPHVNFQLRTGALTWSRPAG